MEKVYINRKRFIETIKHSSEIGASTGGGLNRLALTKEDKEMRDLFVSWLKMESLDVRVDDFGNIYGRRKGQIENEPPIVIGSHLDTQPKGGRFDGVIGVLAALEVIRVLNENEIETYYPIEIVNFTNEEGARFEPPMLGSGGITGVFDRDEIYQTKDRNGITFLEALKEIGYLGKESNRLTGAKAFIELHIEQGPILDQKNISIGVVEGIQGISWLNVTVIGRKNHAGPTPMNIRKDALLMASKIIVEINKFAQDIPGLKVTIGKLDVDPNVSNIIPGQVNFSVDVRHEDDEIRTNFIRKIKNFIQYQADETNMNIETLLTWDSPAVHFSQEIQETIETAAKKLEYSTLHLYSGPGHDAKYMDKITKTGMIFTKSKHGISHAEDEFTTELDLERGANTLLNTVLALAVK